MRSPGRPEGECRSTRHEAGPASVGSGLPRPLSLAALTLVVVAAVSLSACVPTLIAVGVGAGTMIAADPRSTGAQVDDESIELKIQGNEIIARDNLHINVTSYNGVALLTGEVPTPAARDQIERIAKATERVRGVQNELVVAPNSELSERSNDSFITSKVTTRFLNEGKFAPNRVKVVTERSVVYLMGLVTRDEATSATQIAATTSGVTRVVKVFEYTN